MSYYLEKHKNTFKTYDEIEIEIGSYISYKIIDKNKEYHICEYTCNECGIGYINKNTEILWSKEITGDFLPIVVHYYQLLREYPIKYGDFNCEKTKILRDLKTKYGIFTSYEANINHKEYKEEKEKIDTLYENKKIELNNKLQEYYNNVFLQNKQKFIEENE